MTLYTGAFLPPAQKLMEFIDASGKTILKSEDATLNGETWRKRRIVQLKSDLYVEVYDFAARLWEQDVEFGLFGQLDSPYYRGPSSDLYRSKESLISFISTVQKLSGSWRTVSTNEALRDVSIAASLRAQAMFDPYVGVAFHAGYRPSGLNTAVISLGQNNGAVKVLFDAWRIRNSKLVTNKSIGALNSGVSLSYNGDYKIRPGNTTDIFPSGLVTLVRTTKGLMSPLFDSYGGGVFNSDEYYSSAYVFSQLALSWSAIRIAQGVTTGDELSVPTRWISLPVANRVSFYDDQIFVGFLPEFGENASWVFVSSVDPTKGNSYSGATGILAYDTGDTTLPPESELPSGKQIFAEANSASVAGTHYMAMMALSDLPYASDSVSGGLISSQVYAIGPLGAPEVRGPIAGLLRCHSSVGTGQVGHFNSRKHACLVPTYMFETP